MYIMKKYFKIAVIFVLTLGCLGNSDYASANEQVSNAQIYKKLIEIDKKVTEIEKNQIKLEQTFKAEIKRIDQKIDYLDQRIYQRIGYVDQRIDTLNTTTWSIFGFLGTFIVAITALIIALSLKIGRFMSVLDNKE